MNKGVLIGPKPNKKKTTQDIAQFNKFGDYFGYCWASWPNKIDYQIFKPKQQIRSGQAMMLLQNISVLFATFFIAAPC